METKALKKKVLLVSLYGCWPDFVSIDKSIIDHLSSADYTVDNLICGSAIPFCDQILSYKEAFNVEKNIVCQLCINSLSNRRINGIVYSQFNLKDFTDPEFYLDAQEKLHNNPSEFISWCSKNGLNLTALSNQQRISSRWYLTHLDAPESPIGLLLKSAYVLKRSVDHFLSLQHHYQCVILTHPHRSLMSVIVKQFNIRNIPVLGYTDCGTFDESSMFFFSMDESIVPKQTEKAPKYIQRHIIATYEGKPLEPTQTSLALTYEWLTTIHQPAKFFDAQYYAEATSFKRQELNSNLLALISTYSFVLCLFTSTEAENLATIMDSDAEVQYNLHLTFIELAKKNPNYLFIIRDHPNRYITKCYPRPEPTYWVDLLDLRRKVGPIPSNVIYIYPWIPVDSHQLLKFIDIAICPSSSIAADASLAGCMVITSDYSSYASLAYMSIPETCKTYSCTYDLLQSAISNFTDVALLKLRNHCLSSFDQNEVDKYFILASICSSNNNHFRFNRTTLETKAGNISLAESLNAYLLNPGAYSFNKSIQHLIEDKNPSLPQTADSTLRDIAHNIMHDAHLTAALYERWISYLPLINASETILDLTSYIATPADLKLSNVYFLSQLELCEMANFCSVSNKLLTFFSVWACPLNGALIDTEYSSSIITLVDVVILKKDGCLHPLWKPSLTIVSLLKKLQTLVGCSREESVFLAVAFAFCMRDNSEKRLDIYIQHFSELLLTEDIGGFSPSYTPWPVGVLYSN